MNATPGMLVIALVAMLTVACNSLGESTPPQAASSTFDVVGVVTGHSVTSNRLIFDLEGGDTVEFDRDVVRVLFESGAAPRLLISGRDKSGDWLVVVGGQEGMPSDCSVVNAAGIEWGKRIDLFGILWPKSDAFQVDMPLPALGSPYPDGTRFCLDASARVAAAIRH